MPQRPRQRRCRQCSIDLSAKFRPGTKRLQLPPMVTLQTTVIRGGQITTTVNFCLKCAAVGMRVWLDSVIEHL